MSMSTFHSPYYAALDLGSNSFHLIIAQLTENGIQEVDKIKHMVRLGEGLQKDGTLDSASMNRALEALSEMHQRIAHIPSEQVRAVGTNTLRVAKNGKAFLKEAERCLGTEIEIISGQEEARLIYLGVTTHNHYLGSNLVIDVGGGSTEVIIGEGNEAKFLRSMKMGCANMATRFFPKGKMDKSSIEKAIAYAAKTLEPHRQQILNYAWQRSILSSGTAKNTERVLTKLGLSDHGVSAENLSLLLERLASLGKVEKLADKLEITPERAFGFTGGVCIIASLFKELDIKTAIVSQQALREGVLLDLMGKSDNISDERQHTVHSMQKRFNIDTAQAARVAELAEYINGFMPLEAPPRMRPLLKYAAALHEIGLSVARGKHQNHGAYLMEHADMPGFSQPMQQTMAILVKGQRKKMPVKYIDDLPTSSQPYVWQWLLALRLAVLLFRSRISVDRDDFPKITYQDNTLTLTFDKAFLDAHPLTLSDLEDEQKYWASSSHFQLNINLSA